MYLHLGEFWEIPRRDLIFLLNLGVDLSQISDQLLLLILLTKHVRHLLLQGTDDVCLHLNTHTHTHAQWECGEV